MVVLGSLVGLYYKIKKKRQKLAQKQKAEVQWRNFYGENDVINPMGSATVSDAFSSTSRSTFIDMDNNLTSPDIDIKIVNSIELSTMNNNSNNLESGTGVSSAISSAMRSQNRAVNVGVKKNALENQIKKKTGTN